MPPPREALCEPARLYSQRHLSDAQLVSFYNATHTGEAEKTDMALKPRSRRDGCAEQHRHGIAAVVCMGKSKGLLW